MNSEAANNTDLFGAALSLAFGLLFVLYFYLVYRDGARALREWAERENLTIVEKEFRLFRTGPFFFPNNRPVYKCLVKSASESPRKCWVMCRTLVGSGTKNVDVHWE